MSLIYQYATNTLKIMIKIKNRHIFNVGKQMI